MEVLVTTKILGVENAAAAFPVINADVAGGFCRQAARLAYRRTALERLHKHVHASRCAVHRNRLHEAQRAAVIAQTEIALFRIAEKVANRVELGHRWRLSGGLERQSGGQCGTDQYSNTHDGR